MRIYLDHGAATPVRPEVQEAMLPFFREHFGNAGSLHAEGFSARDALANAREQIARFVGAESSESILFTGSGTEAVNLGIIGAALANQRRGKHILLSSAEHPAVARSVEWLTGLGFEMTILPVDFEGRLDPAEIRAAMRPDTILVCTHHTNHDIGTVQDLQRIGAITAERGALLFVDATASAGWLPVNVQSWRADLLALSPHRFYGPKGVGVLYRHRRARLQPLVHGGDQEEKLRAGTENVPAIVGAGKAAELAETETGASMERLQMMQVRIIEGMTREIEYWRLNGPKPGEWRHPANLNVSIEFAEGEALGLMLDVKGFSVATGSACVIRDKRVPPVLAAIGLPESLARGNVIVTLGRENTAEEVEHFVSTFAGVVRRLREMSPEWEDFQKGLVKSELVRGGK